MAAALVSPAGVEGRWWWRRRGWRRWRFRFFSQPISQQTTDYRTCGSADGASYCETILTILGGCDASPDTAPDNGARRGAFQGCLLPIGHVGATTY